MAYTSPTTRSTGNVITAAQWNTDLVDNIAFLHKPPRCAVYNSASQSLTSGTRTTLTFNSEHFDTDTMHSTATNPSRITFTTGGCYLITAQVAIDANATGLRELVLRYNGASDLHSVKHAASASEGTILNLSVTREFGAGTYVELMARQTSGVALNAAVLEGSPFFSAVWVGGL